MAGLDLNQLAFAINSARGGNAVARGSDPVARGLAGAGLASGAGQYFGGPSVSSLAGNVGTGLGLAATGYGIYNDATNPNLSTTQRAGHAAGDAAGAVLSYLYPYVGLGLAAKAVVGQLERSGSPQVAATGRALSGPALPVEGLLSVLQGDQTPKEAFNTMIARTGRIPIVGHAMKQALQAFGLGTPPTHGTMFRNDMTAVAKQMPELKGFDINKGGFAKFMDPKQYDAYSLDDRMAAMRLANYMAPASHQYDNPQRGPAYSGQLQRALLGNYGDQLPGMEKNFLNRVNTPPPAPPAPAQLKALSDSNWATQLVRQQQHGGTGTLVAQANNILAGMGAH